MNTTSNVDHISVIGIHNFIQQAEYRVKIIISLDNLAYEDSEKYSFQDIKDMYMGKLVDNGIAGSNECTLSENDLEYALLNFQKKGTVLICKTSSLEIVEKILKVNSEGIYKQDTSWEPILSDAQMTEYFESAFADAKNRAEGIAKSLGRTLGRTISIEDTNVNEGYREYLHSVDVLTGKEYQIKACFEMI